MEGTVAVDYREDNGWHVFTSKDVPELLIAHADPLIAFRDITVVLEQLMLFNSGTKCTFTLDTTAEEFFAGQGRADHLRAQFRQAA